MPKVDRGEYRIGLDTETTGKDFKHGSRPYLVTISRDDGTITHWEADVDPFTREVAWDRQDLAEIRREISRATKIVMQNPCFDVRALRTIDSSYTAWDWGKTYDTLLNDHLIKSSRPHDLTTQALVYLGVDLLPLETAVKEATKTARKMCQGKRPKLAGWRITKKGLEDMPSAGDETWKTDMWLLRAVAAHEQYPDEHPWWRLTSEYANGDSAVLLPIFDVQAAFLKENDLWTIAEKRRNTLKQRDGLETRGLTLSGSRQEELAVRFKETSRDCGNICKTIAEDYGHTLELPKNGRNNNLDEFVFEKMRLPIVSRTDTGGPSLNKYAMETYLATLPPRSKELTFVERLLQKRSADTALSFNDGYYKYRRPVIGDWYRLYPFLNATGTATLRWSSQGPNEQQISKQENFNLRYLFGPMPGREWWSLDYQNIELRIPAYESNERVMIDLFEKPNDAPFFGSNHLFSASIVYPELFWPLADQKGAFKKKYEATYYKWIKGFNFAMQYGAVLASGTADRAARRPGAQKMLMERLTEHSRLNQRMIDLADSRGYVETIPDSEVNPRRGYPLYCTRTDRGKVLETVPLNYHVQGTACWVMMCAMDEVQEVLDSSGVDGFIVAQIHDELVLDLPFSPDRGNLPLVRRVQRAMERMGDRISIPLTVGVDYHEHDWSRGVSV